LILMIPGKPVFNGLQPRAGAATAEPGPALSSITTLVSPTLSAAAVR
jgi:hypothetical protein